MVLGPGHEGPTEEQKKQILDIFRKRLKDDPNFDPFEDETAYHAILSAAPDDVREFILSLDNLEQHILDATEGPDKIDNFDQVFKNSSIQISNEQPQSKWFQAGKPPPEVDDDESLQELKSIIEDLQKSYPNIKPPNLNDL